MAGTSRLHRQLRTGSAHKHGRESSTARPEGKSEIPGSQTPSAHVLWQMNAMTCTVLPNPISSAAHMQALTTARSKVTRVGNTMPLQRFGPVTGTLRVTCENARRAVLVQAHDPVHALTAATPKDHTTT